MVLIYNEIMMEKYDKKGFTLVELIVVIAIIAALSVTMGVSTVETLRSTRYKSYIETYADILDASILYVKLKKPADNCQELGDSEILCNKKNMTVLGLTEFNGDAVNGNVYAVPLCCVAAAGLIDEDIFEQSDPLVKSSKTKFSIDRQIFVYTSNGVVKSAVTDFNGTMAGGFIRKEDLESYSCWKGEC